MDKKILTAIIVVFLLNSAVILVGFGVLQNQINQLKTEELESSTTESQSKTQNEPYIGSLTRIPQSEKSSKEPEAPSPEQPTEEKNHYLMAPKHDLKLTSWESSGRDNVGNPVFDGKVEGTIVNPNNGTLYNVKITVTFPFVLWKLVPLGEYTESKTIHIGTMKPNQSIKIDKTYSISLDPSWNMQLMGIACTVEWDE